MRNSACSWCGEVIRRRKGHHAALEHIRTAHPEVKVRFDKEDTSFHHPICDECGTICCSFPYLKRHIEEHHTPAANPAQTDQQLALAEPSPSALQIVEAIMFRERQQAAEIDHWKQEAAKWKENAEYTQAENRKLKAALSRETDIVAKLAASPAPAAAAKA